LEQRADTAIDNQADRLASATGQSPQAADDLTNDEVRDAQTALKDLGLYDGEIDGLYGRRTIEAVGRYQAQNDLPQTRALDEGTIERLQTAAASPPGTQQRSTEQPSTPTSSGG
jgi:general secretion pathway protein A